MKFTLLLTVFALGVSPLLAQTPLYLDNSADIEDRIEDVMKRLTTEEKIAMVHAQSKFSSPGVKRLGIPDIWTSDGPHGVRPEVLWDEWNQAGWTNDSCVAFPALTCLAATWNEEVSHLYGKSIGEEARFRNKSILLGPGVNIYRTPLNGRNFEYMGDNLSVLRYIANNSVQKENSPIRAIMDFATHMLWFRSVSGNNYIGFETGVTSLEEWIIGKGYVKDFNAFLNAICGMNVNLGIAKGADGKQMLVEKHANGPLIFWQVRSSGTSAAELFFFWMKRFDEVSFLFLDEYDAFYHFELAGRIIDKLKTYKELQVIFTTHNTSLMGNSILRPDCYMLLADGKLRSYIDRAGGREIREGHNLEKIYRNGGLND